MGLPRLPGLKASLFTIVFAVIGLWVLLFRAPVSMLLLPESLFYVVLLLNTFYSIRLYAAIQPDDLAQALIDLVLVLIYLRLALTLGTSLNYFVAATVLFIAATPKYMLMRGKIQHDALLRRKVKIDATGITLCAVSLAITYLGHPLAAAWLLASVFTLANIYLLWIRPMYVIDEKSR